MKLLQISKSSIPNAGLGVYVNQDLQKNDMITVYSGNRITKQEFEELLDKDHKNALEYSVHIPNSSDVILGNTDIRDTQYCGQLINDIACISNKVFNYQEGVTYLESKKKTNCEIMYDALREMFVITATRDINIGEELFLHYGYNYWTYGMELHESEMDDYLNLLDQDSENF